ncbi:hemerythrin domain-containing protein [Nocardioides sp.]|jgi:iron-sulfur cluster repair protein YtfE (RIC family)|uniref:hemerythrin domain-containing protein n=1 Tax=Nocardioides sp. TaxID=35761 RepID=UPI0031FF444B|nr:hypothetical protein [Nocardioides sp.]
MITTPEGTFAGQQMVATLRAFHAPLRNDVAALRQALDELSQAVVDVEHADVLIQGLTTADLAWQLRSGCQWYCSALEGHHGIEDTRMLPVMEREFPQLRPHIKKLRRQHEDVLDLLQAVVRASRSMSVDRPETILTVRDLVTELADALQEHLDLEEDTLFPYFLQMDRDWHHG